MEKKPTYEELEQRIRTLEKRQDVSEGIDSTPENPEAVYRRMLESISDTVIVTDDQGNMVYVCPNTEKIFGLSQDEVLSLNTIQKLMNGSICDISELKEQGELQNIERSIKDISGQTRFLLINVKSVNINGSTVLYVMRDITNRKQDEEELKRYRNIVSSTLDGISLLDKDYRYVIVNDAYKKISGIDRENFIGLTISEYLGKEVFEKYIQPNFDKCLQGETVNYQEWFEYSTLGKRFVDITYYPYRGSDNKITGVIANTRDITERKQAEEALRESEEKYRTLLINIPGMIYRAMPDWSVKIISNSEIVAGYSINEFIAQKVNWLDLIHRDDKQQIFEGGAKLAKKQMAIIQEYRILAKDGSTHWVSDHKASVFKEDGSFICIDGIVYDITDRKRAEEERVSRARLQAVLKTTGAVCHELNQPLQVILSLMESARDDLDPAHPLQQDLKDIRANVDKLVEITRKLNNITSYQTKDYMEGIQILDLDKSSGA